MYRWHIPESDSDWCEFANGHIGCLRFGSFKAGVRVRIREAKGKVAEVTGIVTSLVPTWGDGVTIAVDWKMPKGVRLTPCWPADRLEIVSAGVKVS